MRDEWVRLRAVLSFKHRWPHWKRPSSSHLPNISSFLPCLCFDPSITSVEVVIQTHWKLEYASLSYTTIVGGKSAIKACQNCLFTWYLFWLCDIPCKLWASFMPNFCNYFVVINKHCCTYYTVVVVLTFTRIPVNIVPPVVSCFVFKLNKSVIDCFHRSSSLLSSRLFKSCLP